MLNRVVQRLSISAVVVLAVVSGGCEILGIHRAPEARLAMDSDEAKLQNTTWRLRSARSGPDSIPVAGLPSDAVIELSTNTRRDEGDTYEMSGNTGCNMFSGEYTLKGHQISFFDLVATEIYCGERADEVERTLLEGLLMAGAYEIRGSELTIANGEHVLVFEATK